MDALAQEAQERYHADPDRLQRALEIARQGKYMIFEAKRDEFDQPVQQSRALIVVRAAGGQGWYFVRPHSHSCSCSDAQFGHVCKHRLAAWMFYEVIDRGRAQVMESSRRMASQVKHQQNLKELGF
jgi:uncharacterized Zn finger protein